MFEDASGKRPFVKVEPKIVYAKEDTEVLAVSTNKHSAGIVRKFGKEVDDWREVRNEKWNDDIFVKAQM